MQTLVFYAVSLVAVWWLSKVLVLDVIFNRGTNEVLLGQERVIDVVGVAYKPTCVTKMSIDRLNAHLSPRYINVFTTSDSKCAKFKAMAPNVRCYYDGDVVPKVTKKSVDAFLAERFGEAYADALKSGKKLAGWYLQQFVKLGVARYLDDLSEHFLIWDLDMIPLRNMVPFTGTQPTRVTLAEDEAL